MENETKTKNKFWKGVLIGVLITLFAGLILVGGAAGLLLVGRTMMDSQTRETAENSTNSGESVGAALDYRRIQKKMMLLKRIVDQYFLFDSDTAAIEDGIYKGMMSALDDPYTVYYTPEEYQELTEETEGTYYGIGALVSQDINSGIVTILRVFPDSPAEESGLQKGDILYQVNGLEAAEQDLDLLVSQEIRGAEGTTVKLVILRDGEEIEVSVTRRQVEVATVDHEMLDDGKTGYVMVSQFDVITAGQFEEAINDLETQGMTQLVIDLRDNPGGVLDTAVAMAAYILPEDQMDGTILSTANRDGKGVRYYCKGGKICFESSDGSGSDSRYPQEDGHEVDLPMVILVNGNSASASELFSGALKDYGVAKLVGTKTFGKGIVQSLVPLDDGSAVKITTAHYYTPSGFDLHEKGLEPDVEVEYELPEDLEAAVADPLAYDNQIAAALEVLAGE
ncbi:MAG: S41 family peptidase [Clostridiales bacterium]|nr:S41 family peptidase [Clostridiales bacterium]